MLCRTAAACQAKPAQVRGARADIQARALSARWEIIATSAETTLSRRYGDGTQAGGDAAQHSPGGQPARAGQPGQASGAGHARAARREGAGSDAGGGRGGV